MAKGSLAHRQSGVNHWNYRHGASCGGILTRLYKIWRSMKTRCYNSHDKTYAHYGRKGISICDEWRNNFGAFRDWAISNGYRDDLTLDRKNGSLGYSPDNCRWATRRQQGMNARHYNPLGFRGVQKRQKSPRSRIRWRAVIWDGTQKRHLGYFNTIDEAARAYDAVAKQLHGEFAILNFPGE